MSAVAVAAEIGRVSVPYVCAALGGIWAERSGVIHIGLEGVLLLGALAATVATQLSGHPMLGLTAAIAFGIIATCVHGILVERARVHAVVSGIALNMFAFALSRLVLKLLYDSASNSPSIVAFDLSASGGGTARALVSDPIVWLVILIAGLSPWTMKRTRLGLRIRAVGDDPVAALSTGVPVTRTRLVALGISGAICALGGAHLAFDLHRFESGMSSGRGFLALAVVVVAGWRIGPALVACISFAALETAQIRLQGALGASRAGNLVQLLPFAAALVALALGAGRGRAPRGLGKLAEP